MSTPLYRICPDSARGWPQDRLAQGGFARAGLADNPQGLAALHAEADAVYSTLGTLYIGDGFAPPVTDLPSAFYFAIVVLSTLPLPLPAELLA